MAQGDAKMFRAYIEKRDQGDYSDLDTYTITFLSDTYASISSDAANPNLASFTEVSGGNITATNLTGFSITRATTTITTDAADPATFAKNASNPATVRTAFVYNNTSASDDAGFVYDLTTDGSTAVDLVNKDLTFSFGANGLEFHTLP